MNSKGIVCWECGKRGHPARLCKSLKKVISYNPTDSLVCTLVLAADTPCPIWFIDSGATKHITRDRDGYTSFRSVRKGRHKIFLGNNAVEDVIGIGDYHLQTRVGKTLIQKMCCTVLGCE